MKKIFLVIAAFSILLAGCVQEQPIGGDKDEHGCLPAAGYTWCEGKQKCLREWEEPCNSTMNLSEARAIALNSDCMKDGNLTNQSLYSENTLTWWLDLDSDKPGCAPACVVDEKTKTAQTNWRCTGAIPPEEGCFKPCHIYINQINYTDIPPICSNATQICTMEYRMGDICLKFVDCNSTNNSCNTLIDPEFYNCISCFEDALTNKTLDANACEHKYTTP